MNKKEFVFPGIILGLVLIIAIGLLLTQGKETPGPIKTDIASSSMSTSTAGTSTGSHSSAISTTPSSYYVYGKTILSVNQVAGFKSGVSIRPVTVIEDSRCPAGVECIQAGTVKISLREGYAGQTTMHTLSLGESFTSHGTKVTFTEAAPLKTTTGVVGPYQLTFIVEPIAAAHTACFVGGCSQEICSDVEGQVSSCIYTPSYGCYKHATCERQVTGKCGWTQTIQLTQCLANPPA